MILRQKGLTLIVKLLNLCAVMKTAFDSTRDVWYSAMRMAMAYARMEEQPIRFGDGLVATPREIHTVYLVGSRKRTNVTDVAQFFNVTKSAASQMVSKLVDKGYLRKDTPSDNNKECILELTDDGRQAFEAHRIYHEKHMRDFAKRLTDYPPKHLEQARHIMQIIEQVLHERLEGTPL